MKSKTLTRRRFIGTAAAAAAALSVSPIKASSRNSGRQEAAPSFKLK